MNLPAAVEALIKRRLQEIISLYDLAVSLNDSADAPLSVVVDEIIDEISIERVSIRSHIAELTALAVDLRSFGTAVETKENTCTVGTSSEVRGSVSMMEHRAHSTSGYGNGGSS